MAALETDLAAEVASHRDYGSNGSGTVALVEDALNSRLQTMTKSWPKSEEPTPWPA